AGPERPGGADHVEYVWEESRAAPGPHRHRPFSLRCPHHPELTRSPAGRVGLKCPAGPPASVTYQVAASAKRWICGAEGQVNVAPLWVIVEPAAAPTAVWAWAEYLFPSPSKLPGAGLASSETATLLNACARSWYGVLVSTVSCPPTLPRDQPCQRKEA